MMRSPVRSAPVYDAYYLTNTGAIASYIKKLFNGWGYYVELNKSDGSDSEYLNINLGTHESPQAFHVRISNHSPGSGENGSRSQFKADIYAALYRENAASYIMFIAKMAQMLDKPLPPEMRHLERGTLNYRRYMVAMQKRAVLFRRRHIIISRPRLYVA
jgi:hypothetical protein